LSVYPWLKGAFSKRYVRGGIGFLIAALSLYLATRDVSFADVKNSLGRADLAYVTWALMSTLAIILARVLRWKMLIGKAGTGITNQRIVMALLAGQALNLIYPARIGDVSRAYFVDESGSKRAFMFGTIVLEKLLDSLAYVLLFGVLVLILPLPQWVSSSGYTFAILTVFSLGIVFLFAYKIDWFSKMLLKLTGRFPLKVGSRVKEWVVSGLNSLRVMKSPQRLLQLFALSLVIWVIPILTNHLTLLALDIRLPITASLLTMIVLQASVAIPSVPGRIGLFEYLCVLSLSLFGISEGLAFTYGVLLHIIALLPSTLAGILFLWILSSKSTERGLSSLPAFNEQADYNTYDRSE
jgi:glycosyltransferase 2 family protein